MCMMNTCLDFALKRAQGVILCNGQNVQMLLKNSVIKIQNFDFKNLKPDFLFLLR